MTRVSLSPPAYSPAPERTPVHIEERCPLFIDGRFVSPRSRKWFRTINPATEEDLAEVAQAGAKDVDLAVAAARGGAAGLTLVESSAGALELARQNAAANAADCPARFEQADAFRFARRDDGEYDLVVIDPPPLARRRHDLPRASRAYKDVLLSALRRAAPEALVLAFACSHHVGAELLRKIAFDAARDAGRTLQVLVETPLPDQPGRLTGTSSRYTPVELSGPEELSGQFVEVTAGPVINGKIQGEAVRKPDGRVQHKGSGFRVQGSALGRISPT